MMTQTLSNEPDIGPRRSAQKVSDDTQAWRKFRSFMAEDNRDNVPGYQAYMDRLFGSIDLQGKRVLEIGSGRGLISLYCALQGASQVVSLEPEMEGSTQGVLQTHQNRARELELSNVEVRRDDFNESRFDDEQFDVIVMIAVLNHLHETTDNASSDGESRRQFTNIAGQLHRILKPGGVAIATDACRYSLWTQARRLGYPRQLCLAQRTINWKIHQQPAVWSSIFTDAGFSRCDIRYPIPFRLRHLSPILTNRVANWALSGEFILLAHR
tara:strand:+ start:63165 stop:63971 length:807 start_codon:yes stop_codon:yes gene_type:complete